MPDFTQEEVDKFIKTAKLVKDKGLDNAIKAVWGDLDAQLEQERADSTTILLRSIGRLRRSHNSLKTEFDGLSASHTKLRKQVYQLETDLSNLMNKLSENRKIKKLLE